MKKASFPAPLVAGPEARGGDFKGLGWENTFAFGDDNNDLPVFAKVRYPIAMGNATPELIQKSKWVTDSNDEDGVGKTIENYILADAESLLVHIEKSTPPFVTLP